MGRHFRAQNGGPSSVFLSLTIELCANTLSFYHSGGSNRHRQEAEQVKITVNYSLKCDMLLTLHIGGKHNQNLLEPFITMAAVKMIEFQCGQ